MQKQTIQFAVERAKAELFRESAEVPYISQRLITRATGSSGMRTSRRKPTNKVGSWKELNRWTTKH